MLKEQIVVGNAYVNSRAGVLREIVEEVDEQRIRFNAFELETGRLLPSRHRISDRHELASWAEREASPAEKARIHPYADPGRFDPLSHRHDQRMELEAAKAALESTAGPHRFPPAR